MKKKAEPKSTIWLARESGDALERVQEFPHKRIAEAQKALRAKPPEPGKYRLVRLFDEVTVEDVTRRKVRFS